MYKLFLAAVFCLLSFTSFADDFLGKMSCQIKTQNITKIKNGIPNSYAAFESGKKKGDYLIFTYVFVDGLPLAYLDFSDETLIGVWPKEKPNIEYGSKKFATKTGTLRIAKNIIIMESQHLKSLWLRRYQKNYWNGIFVKSDLMFSSDYTEVLTLDCRDKANKLEEFIEAVELSK
jgi:hypothetical protein